MRRLLTPIFWLLSIFRYVTRRTSPSESPQWEAVLDQDGVMVHIRWSQPDHEGKYLWVSHYPATNWGRNVVEREVNRRNARLKRCTKF